MTKITYDNIIQMDKLLKEGKKLKEIALMFKLSPSTVSYHLDEDQNKKAKQRSNKYNKKKSKKQVKLENQRKKEYRKKWFKNKYYNDESFRKKIITNSMNYKIKKRLNK